MKIAFLYIVEAVTPTENENDQFIEKIPKEKLGVRCNICWDSILSYEYFF